MEKLTETVNSLTTKIDSVAMNSSSTAKTLDAVCQ